MLTLLVTMFSCNKEKEKLFDREDYGCYHENHSQYDDGDSLNLEASSYNL